MKFKDISPEVVTGNVSYTVQRITDIIKQIGPRESGSAQSYAAQEMLKKDLADCADEIYYETYEMAPKAFIHFTKTVSAAVFAAITGATAVKYNKKLSDKLPKAFPHALIAAVDLASLGITAGEFLLYKQMVDGLYTKVEGKNLIAVRKPKGEIKKRIIICGHIDSAYEWRHIYYGKGKLMTPVMATSIATAGVTAALSTAATVFTATGKGGKFGKFISDKAFPLHFLTLGGMAALYPFVDFKTLSPGANDNLTGTLAAVCALKMLDQAGIEFENTEVVCMINDGEEAGLRGSKAYAQAHLNELTDPNVKTSVLCVDTLTDLKDLNVYNRDMTGTVKLDEQFCQLVREAAEEAGHPDLKFASVFFGSSDAAAYAQKGISASCLAAMDPTPADYYHNRRDSYDRLVPEAIKTGYEIILSTILKFADED